MVNYDIGLVRTFTTVYETRSVTKAAERLFVTQPSISYALKRLRTIFRNDLFVRQGQEMLPTAVAERIYPRLRGSLETLDQIMHGEDGFDPPTSRRKFRLQMTDVGTAVLLEPIVKAAAQAAPNVRIEVEGLRLSRAPGDLLEGRLDAFLCTPKILHPDIRRDPLFRHNYMGICAIDHPRIGPNPTLSDFLQERHINLTGEIGHHIVDDTLLGMGHTREVMVSVPNFLALPPLLSGSNLVSFAPLFLAQKFEASGELMMFKLPVEIPATEVSLCTYRRSVPSPSADWFRELVRTSLIGINLQP